MTYGHLIWQNKTGNQPPSYIEGVTTNHRGICSTCSACSCSSCNLVVSTQTRSSLTQSCTIWMDIGLVDKSSALRFTACWCVTCTICTIRCASINVMWFCQKGIARQLVAVVMLYVSPVPCFVAVMQTTTVTTNIVGLVWHMLNRTLLLMGVTYRMELMMTMMISQGDELVYTMIVDMIWWSDSHKMLLLICMKYCF